MNQEWLILYLKQINICFKNASDSAHPRHCFPGIAKSLAHRVVRICSKPEDRDMRLGELRDMLLDRGYKASML